MASYSQPVPPYRRPPSVVPDGQIRLKLVVAYAGGQVHGVAPQPGVATVGDALASALGTVLRQSHPPVLVMAGRTDAGVHAHAQVCHVDINPPPMPPPATPISQTPPPPGNGWLTMNFSPIN